MTRIRSRVATALALVALATGPALAEQGPPLTVSPLPQSHGIGEGETAVFPLVVADGGGGWHRILVESADRAFDPVAEIWTVGEAPEMLASDDDGGGFPNPLLMIDLTPGAYEVRVREFSGAAGAVFVSAGLRPEPPEGSYPVHGNLVPDVPDVPPALDDMIRLDPDGTVVDHLLETGGQAVWFLLEIEEDDFYRIDAIGLGSFDAVLDLRAAADAVTVIGWDDDGGDGTNARIETWLSADQYLIKVREFYDAEGTFSISAAPSEVLPPPVLDMVDEYLVPPPDVDVSWTELPPGSKLDGRRPAAVWYRFDLEEEGVWQLGASGHEDFDPYIGLYRLADGVFEPLAGDDDSGFGSDSLLVDRLAAGTYFLGVAGYSLSGGTFQVSVSEWDRESIVGALRGALVPSEPAALPELTAGGGPQPVALTPTANHAWYRFAVSETGVYRILTGSVDNLDTVLQLYRADQPWRPLAEDDDGGENLLSALLLALDAGEYWVLVAEFGGGSGSLTLRLEAL